MRRKSLITLIICLLMCGILAGCGQSGAADTTGQTKKEETGKEEKVTEEAEETAEEKKAAEETEENNSGKDAEFDTTAAEKSLAERLAGKYSYHDPGENGEELLIMDVVNFGDNLYAFCGRAMADDGETFEAYS